MSLFIFSYHVLFYESIHFTWHRGRSRTILSLLFPLPLKHEHWNISQVIIAVKRTCLNPLMHIPKWSDTINFIKKETLAQVFSCEFCEIFKNTYFYRTPLVDCFWPPI